MNPKILIIDDNSQDCNYTEEKICNISQHEKEIHGIDNFEIDKSGSHNRGKALLENGLRSGEIYDLMLLDLSIPINEGGAESIHNGLKLLDFALQQNATRLTIVISRHYDNIIDCFRGGAVDFIRVPHEIDTFQQRFLANWDTVVHSSYECILAKRLKTLIPYAERGLTHQYSACFSSFLQSMQHELEKLTFDICDRQSLDINRDYDDPLLIQTKQINSVVENGKRSWRALSGSLESIPEQPQVVVLEEILTKIQVDLAPCFIVNNIKFEESAESKTEVISFNQNTEMIIKEILMGIIIEIDKRAKFNGNCKIQVEINKNKERKIVCVRFRDNRNTIPNDSIQLINQGRVVDPGNNFGRTWGLSIAQHIALSDTGKLVIKPAIPLGNVVTYEIPSK